MRLPFINSLLAYLHLLRQIRNLDFVPKTFFVRFFHFENLELMDDGVNFKLKIVIDNV